jgi:hypothetical protein
MTDVQDIYDESGSNELVVLFQKSVVFGEPTVLSGRLVVAAADGERVDYLSGFHLRAFDNESGAEVGF